MPGQDDPNFWSKYNQNPNNLLQSEYQGLERQELIRSTYNKYSQFSTNNRMPLSELGNALRDVGRNPDKEWQDDYLFQNPNSNSLSQDDFLRACNGQRVIPRDLPAPINFSNRYIPEQLSTVQSTQYVLPREERIRYNAPQELISIPVPREERIRYNAPQELISIPVPQQQQFFPPFINENLLRPLQSTQGAVDMREFPNLINQLQNLEVQENEKLKQVLNNFGGINGIRIPDTLNDITAYCNDLRQQNENLLRDNKDLVARNNALIDNYTPLRDAYALQQMELDILRRDVAELVKSNNSYKQANKQLEMEKLALEAENKQLMWTIENYVKKQHSLTHQQAQQDGFRKAMSEAKSRYEQSNIAFKDEQYNLNYQIDDIILSGSKGTESQRYMEARNALTTGICIVRLDQSGYSNLDKKLAEEKLIKNFVTHIKDPKYFKRQVQEGQEFFIAEGDQIIAFFRDEVKPLRQIRVNKQ